MANSLGLGLRANLSRVLNAFSPAAVAAKQPAVATVKSSAVAKERLAIILAHQRTAGSLQDMLSGVDINTLQAELLACVKVRFRAGGGSVKGGWPGERFGVVCEGFLEKRGASTEMPPLTPSSRSVYFSIVLTLLLSLQPAPCTKQRHVRDSADQSQIQISVRQDGDMEIFEMSVPLGEQ